MESARAAGDEAALANALTGLVVANMCRGKSREALEQSEETLALLRGAQDRKRVHCLLSSLSGFDIARTTPDMALQQAEQVTKHFRQRGDVEGEAYGQLAASVAHTAKLDVLNAEPAKALQAVKLALVLFQTAGCKLGECLAQESAYILHALLGDADQAHEARRLKRLLRAQLQKDWPDLEVAGM